MTSEFDDAIWELVESEGRRPEPWLSALARDFAGDAGAVLDLGCGDGLYLQALGAGGARLHAADRSAVALGRVAERAPDVERHQVGADERLPLDDNCVERVWCCDTLEHVVDTQVALSEARRVLTPGGGLLVVTPDHPFLLRLKLAFAGWGDHFDPFSPHLRFYTRRSLAGALDDCGFTVDAIERRAGSLVARATRA